LKAEEQSKFLVSYNSNEKIQNWAKDVTESMLKNNEPQTVQKLISQIIIPASRVLSTVNGIIQKHEEKRAQENTSIITSNPNDKTRTSPRRDLEKPSEKIVSTEYSNPQTFSTLRAKVISASEIADETDPREKIKKEAMAFLVSAPEVLSQFLQEQNDTKKDEKIAELKKIQNSYKTKFENAGFLDPAFDFEMLTVDYWETLYTVLEREERQALKHGNDFLQKVIPEEADVVFVNMKKSQDRVVYDLKKGPLDYQLIFMNDGRIGLVLTSKVHKKSKIGFFKQSLGFSINKKEYLQRQVSLADLRDPATFDVMARNPEHGDLDGVLGTIDRIFPDFKREPSGKDKENHKIWEFEKRLTEFKSKLWKRKRDYEKGEISPEIMTAHLKEVQKYVAEAVRLLFDVKKESPEDVRGHLANLLQFGYEPALDLAIQQVRNLPELGALDFSSEFTRYSGRMLHNEYQVSLQREKLDRKSLNELGSRISGFIQLSADKQEFFRIMAFSPSMHGIDQTQFVKGLDKVTQETFRSFKEFVENNSNVLNNAEDLLAFTKYSAGLNKPQFSAFGDYYKKETPDAQKMNQLNSLLKQYSDTDMEYVDSFIFETLEKNKIDSLLSQARALESRLNPWDISSLLSEKPEASTEALYRIKHLNVDNLEAHFAVIMTCFEDLGRRELVLLKQILKNPLQRETLRKLKNSDRAERFDDAEDAYDFLSTLSRVKTKQEMDYLKRKSSDGRIIDSYIFEETQKTTVQYQAVFEQVEAGAVDLSNWKKARVFNALIGRGVTPAVVLELLPSLNRIEDRVQVKIVDILLTKDNARTLVAEVIDCKADCVAINSKGNLDDMLFQILGKGIEISDVGPLIRKVSSLENNPLRKNHSDIFMEMLDKASDANESILVIDRLNDANFIRTIQPVVSKAYPNLGENTKPDLIASYFRMDVSPTELSTPRILARGLSTFLNKANADSYDFATDPSHEKLATFLDKETVLAKKELNPAHIAYILNIMPISPEELTEKAEELLKSDNPTLQSKGAMLLIGMGHNVDRFDMPTVQRIAETGLGRRLTKRDNLDKKITSSQLSYMKGEDIPLSLYFSFLIALDQEGKVDNPGAFEAKVDQYKQIENQPVFEGQFLALSHDENDKTHSYLFANDSFNTTAFEDFADLQDRESEVLRHGKDNETLESMFVKLEKTKGDLTLLIGGHGNRDVISFGSQEFQMKQLFERLARRIEGDSEHKTKVIFSSCYSGYNINLLNKMWEKDPRTKGKPIMMLSSSSESGSSAKMAVDSWSIQAQKNKNAGTPLTWKNLYHGIESRSYIMSKGYRLNSNMTLYINGKRLG